MTGPQASTTENHGKGAIPLRSGASAARRHRDFLGVSQPTIGEAEQQEVLAVLQSGWVIAGPRVGRLEHELASYLGVEYIRALSSCTAGLLLGLRLAGVQRDDEVLLPANTFVACANVVEQAGARPVLVDCDPSTGLIDLDQADAMVGPRTRALMPVHLGGRPLDMDELSDLRDRHQLAIIEDAAHAIGAHWDGRSIGAHGNLVSFSFHAAKNMTTIEGGALVVRSAEEATRVERLAVQGLSRSSWYRHGVAGPADYDVIEPGFKLRMSDVAAAIGVHQLSRLEGWLARREALARRYDERLAGLPLELAPALPGHARHARHLYAVKIGRDAPIDRDEVIRRLADHNIGTSVHFQGIHRQSFFRERYGLRDRDLPHATDWALRSLSLPLHPGVSDADQDDVIGVLAEALEGTGRA
jgi:dTDP-4-amino-4,6-dideoxygalactose transaminase